MAATTYYAWSPILYGVDRDTTDPTVITGYQSLQFGDVVTPEKLGYKEDDKRWKDLVDGGSIRAIKPPDLPEGYAGSPIDYLREQHKQAAEALEMPLHSLGGYESVAVQHDLLTEALAQVQASESKTTATSGSK